MQNGATKLWSTKLAISKQPWVALQASLMNDSHTHTHTYTHTHTHTHAHTHAHTYTHTHAHTHTYTHTHTHHTHIHSHTHTQMTATTKLFVREGSMAPVYSMLLFGGELGVHLERALITVS